MQNLEADQTKPRILLVEDDPNQRSLVGSVIGADYDLTSVADGESAVMEAQKSTPDLILLDLRLPGIDGFEVCQRLRQAISTERVPIIFLSGMSDPTTRVAAFEMGADDFLEKPFFGRELVSRIKARLRHTFVAAKEERSIERENLILDLTRFEVNAGGKISRLTPLESALLALFMRNPETILARDAILAKAWSGTTVSPRTVDAHVVSLRKAIAKSNFRIESVYGAGYLFTGTPRPVRKSGRA